MEPTMSMRKSWHERLQDDKTPRGIKPIPPRMQRKHGVGTIVIPTPRDVERVIRGIPPGKLITVQRIADSLAHTHRTTIGCAVTSGICAWIAAHAADEAEAAGWAQITPYWRVLKADGELNSKYPGGIPNLKRRLAREGHVVVEARDRAWVANHETALAPTARKRRPAGGRGK